jgi:hypothetical protein
VVIFVASLAIMVTEDDEDEDDKDDKEVDEVEEIEKESLIMTRESDSDSDRDSDFLLFLVFFSVPVFMFTS